MSLIQISNLTFSYDGSYDNIFENASFQIDSDWKLGFIGRNGRGKTTFFNLLLGKYEYSGQINSSVTFDYFPYEVKNKSELTLNILSEMSSQSEDWEFMRELSLLDIDVEVLYRPFETLSNGEQTKVLLAALFLKEGNFLLIDEPTNHLDALARKTVSNYLKTKKSFILVSHDREFLDESVDHILSINRENIEVQSGKFSTWWENKKRQDEYELKKNEGLKKDISRLKKSADRTSRWSDKVEKSKGVKVSGNKPDKGYVGHKSAKLMKRAKTLETRQNSALEEKIKLLKNIEQNDELKINPLKHHLNRLIEFSDVECFYGEHKVCGPISFIVENGDRVALNGSNGSGKTTILKMILGEQIKYTGQFNVASNLKISYVSQDTSGLKGNLQEYALMKDIDESLFKTILRKMDFERVQFEKNIEDFSSGQKKKVLIAASLCEEAHIYIWDEPLNYIDIFSRMQIEDLIEEFKPTMLFVEHDMFFREEIATKIINM
ncbi:lincosamide and streptogramin A transport system ATP-binding/permease protein [Anaerosphaera aminiphila DSM 21120]|uniref:Lincosamide and streptogramin A transport system ATP-binding/permease protein n=1 Tax=Anaerosphaera aminiphila DSM 21120 TaxID=1120995 RepID=A0A1M5RF90_9FIRM|nr:Lsa family ABC-F type ribosomal protection protein [Anaerosphaera aminiphila]SHH24756.1 lincosamide and streptogramin A transport system ATP-binding/permease protein [Anaerosphaera aminiphila DSM 21120]